MSQVQKETNISTLKEAFIIFRHFDAIYTENKFASN